MNKLCAASVWVMLTILTLQKFKTGVYVMQSHYTFAQPTDRVREIVNAPHNLLNLKGMHDHLPACG